MSDVSEEIAAYDLDGLRERRRELQELDDVVSYVRRVAQGRGDLARAELDRRRGAATEADVTRDLRDVLADRLLGGAGRPPRPAEDFSAHPRAVELDRLCAANGFGRLAELDEADLAALSAVLDDYERAVSLERQRVFAELDALTEELVTRYRDEQAGAGAGDATGGEPA